MTQVRKRLRERGEVRLRLWIVFVVPHEHADAPHAVALLRARRERPHRRAAKSGDEFARSNQLHLPQAPVAVLADDEVVVHGNPEGLCYLDNGPRHVDVGARGRGVA